MPVAIKSRHATLVLLVALSVALAGCLLMPGKFLSQLDIRKDGQFSFSYAGEIHMLALGKLAEMGRKAEAAEVFQPQPCHKDDGVEERKCTNAELAEQKQHWEQERAAAAERKKREADSMKAMLGGIDPADPKAAEELAARLRRQAGWRSVEYRGDGLFSVNFAISGRLDHDFAFPTIERFPMANGFVQVTRHSDGTVRIDAPGFGPTSGGEPFRAMMQGAAMSQSGAPAPGMPVPDGRFTIVTDGEILANNTDEGPLADTRGKRLDWTVNLRSPAAPTALIRLGG